MSFEVDTGEVRRAAKEIRKIAENVGALSSQNVQRMRSSVDQNMEGATADAISEVLSDLSSDIRRISSGLNDVYKALLDYAERIEEADRKAKEEIEAN